MQFTDSLQTWQLPFQIVVRKPGGSPFYAIAPCLKRPALLHLFLDLNPITLFSPVSTGSTNDFPLFNLSVYFLVLVSHGRIKAVASHPIPLKKIVF